MDGHRFHPILIASVNVEDNQHRRRVQNAYDEYKSKNAGAQVRLDMHSELVILAGEDELKLNAAREYIASEATAVIAPIQVAFRETIRKHAEAEGKYIRQTGGSGNYGHCWLRVEPNEPGKGYEFINDIKGGVVPKEYIKPIDQGIQGAMELGILAGFPIVDVKVTLFDGSYHEVDSNEMAFKFAGSIAFKEAARKAHPVLLEPVMAVEVTVPEEFMGVIIGDINSRRGRIEGMEHAAGSQVIKAMVPLMELLSSSAHGRPEYSIQFARYEAVKMPGEGDETAGSLVTKPDRPNFPRPAKRSEPLG